MTRVLGHLRANVVAYVALFVALGGTSYAALKLPAGSVTRRVIRDNSITSTKVKDFSLRAVDFGSGQLPAGPAGPRGSAGERGLTGPAGPPGGNGGPGAPGAAFGVLMPGSATPTADPTSADLASVALDPPAAGRLFAFGHAASLTATCASGAPVAGLYLDGVPVPGTGRAIAQSTPTAVQFAGISAAADDGSHNLAIRVACGDASALVGSPTISDERSLGAVLIGDQV